MKILTVSDEETKYHWDFYGPGRLFRIGSERTMSSLWEGMYLGVLTQRCHFCQFFFHITPAHLVFLAAHK